MAGLHQGIGRRLRCVAGVTTDPRDPKGVAARSLAFGDDAEVGATGIGDQGDISLPGQRLDQLLLGVRASLLLGVDVDNQLPVGLHLQALHHLHALHQHGPVADEQDIAFIADHLGELVASFGEADEGVLVHRFDLDAIAKYRAEWGFFRDRRTDLYAKSIV